MANLRKALAVGLLQGIGQGMNSAAGVYEKERDDRADIRKYLAQKELEKSNLEKEYEFVEGLNDPDAQDRALKLKSAGNLTLDTKSGKYMRYKTGGGGSKSGSADVMSLWGK